MGSFAEDLKAHLAREREFAANPDKAFGSSKVCWAAIGAVDGALAEVVREYQAGETAAEQVLQRLHALLVQALREFEANWRDEDGAGTSTIYWAIRIVEDYLPPGSVCPVD